MCPDGDVPPPPPSSTRVGVVVYSPAIRGAQRINVDGFIERWRSIIDAIEADHEVRLFCLVPEGTATPPPWLSGRPCDLIAFRVRPGTRKDRLERLVRRLCGSRLGTNAERELQDAMAAGACSAAVMFTHRNLDLARTISHRLPTIQFVEEFVPEGVEGWGIAPGLLGRLESATLKLALRKVRRFVVISPNEQAWASAEFGARVTVVPHSIDAGYWTAAGTPADTAPLLTADEAFVIGNFGAERNARGLRDVLGVLADDPSLRSRIVLASGTPPHPLLADAGPEVLRFVGAVDDPRPYYRDARATVVPAKTVRGVKTTILQAWAAGCAVVATPASAASVGAVDGVDVLVGDTPRELAAAVRRVLDCDELRRRLTSNGRATLEERFGAHAVKQAVDALLRTL
jgi:glycosyltransferase involved in cell wall biosynthesis